MDNTIILQGSFTQPATAVAQIIQLRSDVDWMHVYNYTQIAAGGGGQGIEYYWQRGMAQGTGVQWLKEATIDASVAGVLAAPNGFYLVDSSIITQAAFVAVTAVSTANPPVVATGSTAGLTAGSSVVRLYNVVSGQQLGGIDYTIGTIVANTSFTLKYMPAIGTAGTAVATTGYRVIPYDPIFYPPQRFISKINKANSRITLTVVHNYQIGQQIRLIIPAAYGMVELNGLQATITNINQADVDGLTNTIDINIDTSGFTTFAFPATTAYPFSPALVVPIGENTAYALSTTPVQNILSDATVNTAYIGMYLPAGANSPGGAAADVVYWVAGKSFSNNGQ